MRTRLLLFWCFVLLVDTIWGQASNNPGNIHVFKVDSSIKALVLRHISFRENSETFSAKLTAEYFQNDTLVEAFNDTLLDDFWGRFGCQDGVMRLTADIGELRSSGFIANITGPDAGDVKHNVCAHNHGEYKLLSYDTLAVCLEVRCSNSELIISSVPDSASDEPVYGFIRFVSTEYLHRENTGFTRMRANMRFYFRAINFEHYRRRHVRLRPISSR